MNNPDGKATLQQRRPVVANPYLKKKPSINKKPRPSTTTTTAAAATTTTRLPNDIGIAPTKHVNRASSATTPIAVKRTNKKKMTVTPAAAGVAAISNDKRPSSAATPASKQGVAGNNFKKPSVTPTPKKRALQNQRHQQQHGGSGNVNKSMVAMTSKNGINSNTPSKKLATAKHHPHHAPMSKKQKQPPTQPTSKSISKHPSLKAPPTTTNTIKQQQPPMKQHQRPPPAPPATHIKRKKQSSTKLKSQLKSQIAQLHRQKRQFLQQKAAEQQRLVREKELEKQRLLQEEERKQRAKRKEEARLKQEDVMRRSVVGKCLSGFLIHGVEKRMELEDKLGGSVHYAIGEAMEGIIATLESRERERLREAKEAAARRARHDSFVKSGLISLHNSRSMPYDNGVGVPPMAVAASSMPNSSWMAPPGYAIHPSMMQYQAPSQQQMVFSSCYAMQGCQVNNLTGQQYPMMQPMRTMVPSAAYHPQQHPAMTQHHHPMQQQPGMMPFTHHPQIGAYNMPPSIMPLAKPSVTQSITEHQLPVANRPISKPANPTMILHPSPVTNPFSPYLKTHTVFPTEICITKKAMGDSFGVTLRWECKSALVPQETNGVNVVNNVAENTTIVSSTTTLPKPLGTTATTTNESKPRKPRRKRVNYGVIAVANATKATSSDGSVTPVAKLHPGDIILSINGRSVGGLTFSEACRAIGTTSTVCSITGAVRCVLTVARMKVVVVPKSSFATAVKQPLVSHQPAASSKPFGTTIGNGQRLVPIINSDLPLPSSVPATTMIPFNTNGDKITSGDFSPVEWAALVRSISTIPHQLFTGMALIPTSEKEVLATIQKSPKYGKFLQCRSRETIEAKLSYESKRIALEMDQNAEKFWSTRWLLETGHDVRSAGGRLTDAQRSTLRAAARPVKGCKCGSDNHEFVNDPKCPLYRDVRQYCEVASITLHDGKSEGGGTRSTLSMNGKARKNAVLEKAYIERFKKLRAENAAIREEAEFVFEMEKIQSSNMKKAVFAPTSLCTLVLSAVASVMDAVPEEGPQTGLAEAELKQEEKIGHGSTTNQQPPDSDSDSESDSDDSEDDVPLNSLLHKNGSKRAAIKSNSPPSKRPKQQTTTANTENGKKEAAAPSPYFLAEILRHVSRTHGHLFQEPTHSDFAWQQRHRSTLTNPLPKDVMFKGNPRMPGSLSFEKIRFLLDNNRMMRLRDAWENPKQMQLPETTSQPDGDMIEKWNDEWIVAHLSSDAMTGLCHEIDVLTSLGILSINTNGKLALEQGWEKKVPQLILNEMKDAWGSEVDMYNLFCIHDRIKSSLEGHWEHVEDGWRIASDNDDAMDDDELVFENDEYQMRKQIFIENYTNWVSEQSGMGEFGV
ncbi:hypothetical protein ACHAXR_007784 [Thalassiosira sp. AJA248-18]